MTAINAAYDIFAVKAGGMMAATKIDPARKREIALRRTFGIISHPDAGKTTLTEKLLLFGGAIQMAGAVKARKAARHTTSDWMTMERERGISISTSVMNFEYRNFKINLLDTPGHQDFSEDTYRVLSAVDSALMVIDNAKGVESQTRKLMEVCRMRNTPIMTFINKLDREGKHPLEVLSEIEDVLQIECAPLNWPISRGKTFRGIYDLHRRRLHLFSPTHGGRIREGIIIESLQDRRLDEELGLTQAAELREEIALLDGAANPFCLEEYLKGNQTPVFYGSAINNFGIKELLDSFVELAPPPKDRPAVSRVVAAHEPDFSGFVFKIQANMDPAHRDRIAFFRICSGRFQRGMKVWHNRLGKEIQLHNATIFMAQERTNVEEALAGDIIGIHNHGILKIGDTLSQQEPLSFKGIPHFAPEHFRKVILKDPLKTKQLEKGLLQLSEEGAVQLFKPLNSAGFILGAVGVLQFEVISARLKDEYNVNIRLEPLNLATVRWLSCSEPRIIPELKKALSANLALDAEGNLAYLAQNEWRLADTMKLWPQVVFHKTIEIRANGQ